MYWQNLIKVKKPSPSKAISLQSGDCRIQQNDADWPSIWHLNNFVIIVLQLQRNIYLKSRLKSRDIEIYVKKSPLRGPQPSQLFN